MSRDRLPFYAHDAIPEGLVTITDLRRLSPPRTLMPGARPVALTRFPRAKTPSELYDIVETTPVDVHRPRD